MTTPNPPEVSLFKNYLTVAVRNLLRHKVYSAINVLGLAIGMACCVLILLFVEHEFRYDRHHENADRIYRVLRETRTGGGNATVSLGTSGALAAALKNDFPEVRQVVRISNLGGWVRYKDRAFNHGFTLADESIFDAFTFPLVKGDAETVLQEPFSVVISEEMARKFFGDEDPMGKVVTAEGRYMGGDYKVTGIMADSPRHSTIRLNFVTATAHRRLVRRVWDRWLPEDSWRPLQTYVVLPEGYDRRELERKLPDLMEQYMGAEVRKHNTYHLQPFTRIYLYSNVDYGIGWYGDIAYVYLLSAIAFFILLIACINFMNLATARSANRAREVGMRKVVGAIRGQLIRQFLSESMLMAFLGMAVAVALARLALPSFNAFAGKELSLDALASGTVLLGLLGVVVFVGLLAGSYPAFFLSAFRPVEVLKGRSKGGSRGAWVRKGLVVFQFSASILFAIGTIVAYQQLGYMRNKKLGFNREQVVVLPIFSRDRAAQTEYEGPLSREYNRVKEAFLQHPNVLKASASHSLPGRVGKLDVVRPEGIEGDAWRMHIMAVDEDFLDLYGIEVLQGRNFSGEIQSDLTEAFLLNETAVKRLGWTEPVGKTFEWPASYRKGRVIGVVRDFHTRSLKEKIGPMAMCMWRPKFNSLSLMVRGEDIPETMAFLEGKWKELLPVRPFRFWFLDEMLDWMYRGEMKFGQIFGLFALLAIIVACLGLFGLAAFVAEQRTKEIGIRKVMGASVWNLVRLLSIDFVVLVALANLIAWPVAYYGMDRWLRDYAYRIDLEVWIFALGGMLALGIALATVGTQAFRAARANPVEALRYE